VLFPVDPVLHRIELDLHQDEYTLIASMRK